MSETINGCKLPRDLENPFDDSLMVLVEPVLLPLYRMGITPNMVTYASILAASAAIYLCFTGHPVLASLLWLLNYIFDIVDGFMARRFHMETRLGSILDHGSDVMAFVGLMAFVISRIKSQPKWPLSIEIILLIGVWYHLSCQEKDTPHIAFDGIDGNACYDRNHLKYTRWIGTGTLTLWHVFLINFYS